MQEWKFALFVLPYISVVAEKTAHFTDVLRSTGCKCKGFYGNAENGTPLQPGYSMPSSDFAKCLILQCMSCKIVSGVHAQRQVLKTPGADV